MVDILHKIFCYIVSINCFFSIIDLYDTLMAKISNITSYLKFDESERLSKFNVLLNLSEREQVRDNGKKFTVSSFISLLT